MGLGNNPRGTVSSDVEKVQTEREQEVREGWKKTTLSFPTEPSSDAYDPTPDLSSMEQVNLEYRTGQGSMLEVRDEDHSSSVRIGTHGQTDSGYRMSVVETDVRSGDTSVHTELGTIQAEVTDSSVSVETTRAHVDVHTSSSDVSVDYGKTRTELTASESGVSLSHTSTTLHGEFEHREDITDGTVKYSGSLDVGTHTESVTHDDNGLSFDSSAEYGSVELSAHRERTTDGTLDMTVGLSASPGSVTGKLSGSETTEHDGIKDTTRISSEVTLNSDITMQATTSVGQDHEENDYRRSTTATLEMDTRSPRVEVSVDDTREDDSHSTTSHVSLSTDSGVEVEVEVEDKGGFFSMITNMFSGSSGDTSTPTRDDDDDDDDDDRSSSGDTSTPVRDDDDDDRSVSSDDDDDDRSVSYDDVDDDDDEQDSGGTSTSPEPEDDDDDSPNDMERIMAMVDDNFGF